MFVRYNKQAASYKKASKVKRQATTSVVVLCYIEGMANNKLTNLQFLFCEFYIQTSNGTLSSRLAGYKGKDDNTHAVNSSRMLRTAKIRAYLKERYADIAMDSDEVLARLAKMARASVSDFVDENGVVDWRKVKKEGYVVKSITHTKGKSSKIEIEGRLRALELIGKAQAMFTDKIEIMDWREELRKHDVEPSKIFEEYVKQFMEVQSDASD